MPRRPIPDSELERFLTMKKMGFTDRAACKVAGFTFMSLWNWRHNKDHKFYDRIQEQDKTEGVITS